MYKPFMGVVALGAALGLVTVEAKAEGELKTADFIAACVADSIVVDDPAFEGSKVTPKAYCECVAGRLGENKLSQTDVDMLTKMHNEDLSDADAEGYPTLEDLMIANEGYEDACKQSLGLSTGEGTDVEMTPMEENGMPDEGLVPDDDAPVEEESAPPE